MCTAGVDHEAPALVRYRGLTITNAPSSRNVGPVSRNVLNLFLDRLKNGAEINSFSARFMRVVNHITSMSMCNGRAKRD